MASTEKYLIGCEIIDEDIYSFYLLEYPTGKSKKMLTVELTDLLVKKPDAIKNMKLINGSLVCIACEYEDLTLFDSMGKVLQQTQYIFSEDNLTVEVGNLKGIQRINKLDLVKLVLEDGMKIANCKIDPTGGINIIPHRQPIINQKVKIDGGRRAVLVKSVNNENVDLSITDGTHTVEEKMFVAKEIIKKVRPFYFCVLSRLNTRPTYEIPTAGVCPGELIYNPLFINKLTLAETIYLLLHEVCHLAMRHHSRGKDKDADNWNIAGDLFINKVLKEEFGVRLGETAVFSDTGTTKYNITGLEGGLYSEKVDIYVDTVETIYNSLEITEKQGQGNQGQQNQQQQGQGQQSGQQQGQQGQGQTQQGQQGQGQQGQGQQGQSQQGQGQQGQGQPQQGQGGQGQKGQSQGGQGQQGQPQQGQQQQGQGTGKGIKQVKYKGDMIGEFSDESRDVVESEATSKMSPEERKNLEKRLLREAATQLERQFGCGLGAGGIERLVKEELAPKVFWGDTFIQKLAKLEEDEFSYAKHNRRSFNDIYGNAVRLKGEVDSKEMLEGVKILIDTSGSIGDEELGKCYNQIKQLLKKYNFTDRAEVIYWDDGIEGIQNFKTIKEFKKMNPVGGGGTNIKPVFTYLEDRKLCKIKPVLTIVFTDGYFDTKCLAKFKKKFNTNTIWVVDGYTGTWEVPFGKLAVLKRSN